MLTRTTPCLVLVKIQDGKRVKIKLLLLVTDAHPAEIKKMYFLNMDSTSGKHITFGFCDHNSPNLLNSVKFTENPIHLQLGKPSFSETDQVSVQMSR